MSINHFVFGKVKVQLSRQPSCNTETGVVCRHGFKVHNNPHIKVHNNQMTTPVCKKWVRVAYLGIGWW